MFNQAKTIFHNKKLHEDKKNIEFEKNDFLALFIAAATVMLPVLLGIFLVIALLVWIIF